MSQRLTVPAIWDGMTSIVLGDLSRLFVVAAPFVLLPSVAAQLFVPPLTSMTEVSGPQLAAFGLVPFLMGNFAQLVVTALALRPDIAAREAFDRALPLWLPYLATLLLATLPLVLMLAVLLAILPLSLAVAVAVVPGLWLFGRLIFLASALIVTKGGSAIDVLRSSWALSGRAPGTLFLFLIVALFGVVGLLMLAGVASAALGALANLVGADAIGRFAVAVISGAASTIVALAGAAASVVCWRELSR